MAVRVYFPDDPKPKEYAGVSIAIPKETIDIREGSMTIRGYGIHYQRDGEDTTTTILPWLVIQQITLRQTKPK